MNLYCVTFLLSKKNFAPEVRNIFQVASSKSESLRFALPCIIDLIEGGYSLDKSYTDPVPSTVVLSAKDFLHIDLQPNYPPAFKHELQDLMSRHFPDLEPIFNDL